jgi:hypothetical protein
MRALTKPLLKEIVPSGKETLTLLASRRPGTTIADVVSLDRRLSLTALYVMDKGTVNPLRNLEDGKGKTILARTEGLTAKQTQELAEQNVPIIHVREIPGVPNIHGLKTHAECGELYGTKVIPYLRLNEKQAENVKNLASQLPEPKKEEEHRQAEKADTIVACLWGYAGC